MKTLNFNSDTYSMFDLPQHHSSAEAEQSFPGLDIIATLEDISSTNYSDEPFCEMSDRNYTH